MVDYSINKEMRQINNDIFEKKPLTKEQIAYVTNLISNKQFGDIHIIMKNAIDVNNYELVKQLNDLGARTFFVRNNMEDTLFNYELNTSLGEFRLEKIQSPQILKIISNDTEKIQKELREEYLEDIKSDFDRIEKNFNKVFKFNNKEEFEEFKKNIFKFIDDGKNISSIHTKIVQHLTDIKQLRRFDSNQTYNIINSLEKQKEEIKKREEEIISSMLNAIENKDYEVVKQLHDSGIDTIFIDRRSHVVEGKYLFMRKIFPSDDNYLKDIKDPQILEIFNNDIKNKREELIKESIEKIKKELEYIDKNPSQKEKIENEMNFEEHKRELLTYIKSDKIDPKELNQKIINCFGYLYYGDRFSIGFARRDCGTIEKLDNRIELINELKSKLEEENSKTPIDISQNNIETNTDNVNPNIPSINPLSLVETTDNNEQKEVNPIETDIPNSESSKTSEITTPQSARSTSNLRELNNRLNSISKSVRKFEPQNWKNYNGTLRNCHIRAIITYNNLTESELKELKKRIETQHDQRAEEKDKVEIWKNNRLAFANRLFMEKQQNQDKQKRMENNSWINKERDKGRKRQIRKLY